MNTSNVTITWDVYPTSINVLNNEDGSMKLFAVGDFVWFDSREEGAGVVIREMYGNQKGPIGMTYLPWRYEKNCWASTLMTLKGDPRFIVCYPTGLTHYGQHVNWLSMVKVAPIDHRMFHEMVRTIQDEHKDESFRIEKITNGLMNA